MNDALVLLAFQRPAIDWHGIAPELVLLAAGALITLVDIVFLEKARPFTAALAGLGYTEAEVDALDPQRAKAIIDKGLLGSIHYGEIDYYHGVGPWFGQYRWTVKKRAGGSSLLSAGCHALDALRGCMDGEVVEVSSYATQSQHKYFKKYEYK